MKDSCNSVEMARNYDQLDAAAYKSIRRFLLMWCRRHFPDPGASGYHGTRAAEKLGISQSFLSEVASREAKRKPGLGLVIRLREQSGATFEEITGHRLPLKPERPLSLLTHDSALAEAAAEDAESVLNEDRPSSTHRSTSGSTAPRKR